jgi:diguanylate cyclase (GGDEF)-like protein
VLYRRIKRRFHKLLVISYVLTILGLVVGCGFAVHQNWKVRLASTELNLQRNAGIGNFIVESALINASKSLHVAQSLLHDMTQSGRLDRQQMHAILQDALRDFATYNNSNSIGLLFFIDSHGLLYARSDQFPAATLDLSDRNYFSALRDHPELPYLISPLVKARTNGLWVLHMAVPIRDKSGAYLGSLVQQLWEKDIASELPKYVDTHSFDNLMIHTQGEEIAFVYPPPGAALPPTMAIIPQLTARQGALVWESPNEGGKKLLLGFTRSNMFDLVSCVSLPMQDIRTLAWRDSAPLVYFALFGVVLMSIIFFAVSKMENRLNSALSDSLHDPLTQLANRRALDGILPRLLRDSMRTCEPLSVLFIDIDHFADFNDNHGHQCGDDALVCVSQSMAKCASRPMDFICRWGGEEFVVLLPHTDELAAQDVANKMLTTVRSLRLSTQKCNDLHISISIGLTTTIVKPDNIHQNLIAAADKAMRQAKEAGRDQYRVFQGAYPM